MNTEYLIYICSMLKLICTRLPETFDALFFEAMRERVLPVVRQEVAAYRNRGVALRRLVGEVMAGEAITRYWGVERAAYDIVRPKGGKPYVEGLSGVFFNISHSGNYVVCAVADREVGVDIERRGTVRLAVARRFFHPDELADLERLSGKERDIRFFDYWSAKEAFLKYVGTGLARPLSSFRVEFAEEGISIWEGDALLPARMRACVVDEGYACHLCTESQAAVEVLEFPWE